MSRTSSLRQLQENFAAMESAIRWLRRSLGICTAIGVKQDYAPEEYDAFGPRHGAAGILRCAR